METEARAETYIKFMKLLNNLVRLKEMIARTPLCEGHTVWSGTEISVTEV